MKLYVISGGPGTGKTSVINELSNEFKVIYEVARKLGDSDMRFKGKSIKEINPQDFQDAIFDCQKKQIEELRETTRDNEIIFSDRGVEDTLAYYRTRKLRIPKELVDFCKSFRYAGIFILDFLKNYKRDTLRQETKAELKEIHEEIIKIYEKLGYQIIFVPFMSVKDRVRFIKERVSINS